METQAFEVPAFERLVQLASEFGPFLFAILFIMFVTRTARGYYNEVSTRTAPAASREELRAYRFYFICSIWAGLAVMALAVGWWVYANWRGGNFYQVAILNLKSDERISADYFTKSVQRPVVPGGSPVHDDYLLIVRDQPFQVGEKFFVSYYKLGTAPLTGLVGVDPVPLEITYAGRRAERFHMGLQDGLPSLVVAGEGATNPQALLGSVMQGLPSSSPRAGER